MTSKDLPRIFFISVVTLLSGCSASDGFNINGYIVRKDQEENFNTLIARAEHSYDLKNYTEAINFGERALELSPGSETASVLLGYILLGFVGLDSFDLARGLSKTPEEAALKAGDELTTLFDKFGGILGLSDDDTLTIGDKESTNLELFKDIDSFNPYSVRSARNLYENDLLRLTNRAIELICPFVDQGAKNPLDSRHSEGACTSTNRVRRKSVDAHFVWAFTHFAEAVVYYKSVQYTEDQQEKTNLDRRTTKLQNQGSSLSATAYVKHVQELQANVSQIFNFLDPDSQARALISTLSTVSLAFSRLPGIPANFTDSIQSALGFLKGAEGEVEGNENEKSFKSFQSQLNKSVSQNLSGQIAEKIANNEVSESEKQELCDSHRAITAGLGQPPEGC